MKTLFNIKIHSVVDVITNSSSELFVGLHDSKKLITEMIMQVYPNYLNEYEEIKCIDDLTTYELDLYVSYVFNGWSNLMQTEMNTVIDGFTLDEMYEKKEYGIYVKSAFVSSNREKIIEAIDPERKMFFLFSSDDNPNWEMQEELERFMTRYHLG